MSKDFTEVSLTDGLTVERVVDLTEFAEEPGGALAPGWYAAEVIEGYATRKGKQIATADAASQQGDSRNLKLALKLDTKPEPRNLFHSINYRPSDFTPERIAFIKEMRTEFKGVRGRWANADAQRSSLAVASLGQLGKASGVGTPLGTEGNVNALAFLGKKVDVRLSVNTEGYNEVTAMAPAGQFTSKPKKS